MAVNKVVYGGKVLIDLTGITVTPETLAEGITAIDAAGNLITGTAVPSTGAAICGEAICGGTVCGGGGSAPVQPPVQPDSGGSASIDTCTVTVNGDVFLSDGSVFFTNADMEIEEIAVSSAPVISVVKNTLLCVTGWTSMAEHSGDCEQLFFAAGKAAYKIFGDCVLRFNG